MLLQICTIVLVTVSPGQENRIEQRTAVNNAGNSQLTQERLPRSERSSGSVELRPQASRLAQQESVRGRLGGPDQESPATAAVESSQVNAQESGVSDQERSAILNALLEACHDESEEVQIAAFQVLPTLDDGSSRVLDAYVDGMESDNSDVQMSAAMAFEMSPASDVVKVERLVSLFRENESLRPMVMPQLTQHRELCMEALCQMLTSNMVDNQVRHLVLEILTTWGPQAVDAVPALCELYRADEDMRSVVLNVIPRIGPGAKEALPLLLEEMTNEDLDIRVSVIQSIAAIGADPERADVYVQSMDPNLLKIAEAFITRFDTNGDGRIAGDEMEGMRGVSATFDRNSDGQITRTEVMRAYQERQGGRGATGMAAPAAVPAVRVAPPARGR